MGNHLTSSNGVDSYTHGKKIGSQPRTGSRGELHTHYTEVTDFPVGSIIDARYVSFAQIRPTWRRYVYA